MKLPVQMLIVDSQTGNVEKTETVNFEIRPAPEGTCPECGKAHEPEQPHDAQSLHYQYTFYAREGRWPTWSDAMAHCQVPVCDVWTQALTDRGIAIDDSQKGDAI
jgi:hypothetical protein